MVINNTDNPVETGSIDSLRAGPEYTRGDTAALKSRETRKIKEIS